MLGEVGAVGEGLATVAAFVWFGFSHMDLGVELKVRLGAETLQIRNCLNYDGKGDNGGDDVGAGRQD